MISLEEQKPFFIYTEIHPNQGSRVTHSRWLLIERRHMNAKGGRNKGRL